MSETGANTEKIEKASISRKKFQSFEKKTGAFWNKYSKCFLENFRTIPAGFTISENNFTQEQYYL